MQEDFKINDRVSATLVKPDKIKKPLPALIFIHGWRSNKTGNITRSLEISKLGFICLSIDLRGHGDSDGTVEEFSRQDHIEDIKNAYAYLENLEHVDKNKIGIVGASYGGYLAAVATNFLKFNRLVLRVPALYFDEEFKTSTDKLIKDDTKAFKTWNLTPEKSLALKGLKNFKGKILIIEAEKDTIIPKEVIENYKEIANPKLTKYVLMRDTPHSLETQPQEEAYIYILKNWLQTQNP